MLQFAKIWTLMDQPSAESEWSVAQKVEQAAKAGFDGIHGILDKEWSDACQKNGLKVWGEFDLGKPEDAQRLVSEQVSHGATRISVQAGDHDSSTERMLELACALQEAAQKEKVYAAIEIHRDTGTETPEKTDAMADAYEAKTGQRLPLNYDFSHPMIIKHLNPENYSERLLERTDYIQQSHTFHLRPANGHHCQIPVTDGKGNLIPEFINWLAFVEDLFVCWLKGPKPVATLYTCPELGPVRFGNYCLSTFPNPWEEAILCKDELTQCWQRALAKVS